MEALVGKRIRPLTVLSPDLAESGSDRSAVPDDGVHTLKRVLDSIRKYKRLVRTIIVGGTLLVAAIGFLMPASYLATAQLAIDIRPSDTAGPSAAASVGIEDSIIDTHVTVLLSDAYLRHFSQRLASWRRRSTAPVRKRGRKSCARFLAAHGQPPRG